MLFVGFARGLHKRTTLVGKAATRQRAALYSVSSVGKFFSNLLIFCNDVFVLYDVCDWLPVIEYN